MSGTRTGGGASTRAVGARPMQAVVCDGNGGLRAAALRRPRPAAGELLLRLRCAGVCGTDLWKLRHGTAPAGAVLGHEVVGTIVAVGAAGPAGDGGDGGAGGAGGNGSDRRGEETAERRGGGPRLAPGDRVVAVHHLACGHCRCCRAGSETMCAAFRQNRLAPGGFSELLVVRGPAAGAAVYQLPPHLADEAAVFLEPVACVLRGLRRGGLLGGGGGDGGSGRRRPAEEATRGGTAAMAATMATMATAAATAAPSMDQDGDEDARPVVAILGAGSMGLLHLLVLRALAAGGALAATPALVALCDPLAARRALARRLGADAAAAPGRGMRRRVGALSRGRGADLVVDTAGGAGALAEAVALGRPGGTIVLFAHAAGAAAERGLGGDDRRAGGAEAAADFPLNAFFKAERRLIATYSSARAEQVAALGLLASGRLDPRPLVTHRLPLGRAAEAVELASSHRALKILLVPDDPAGDAAGGVPPPALGRRR
jgi:L-iditol 2-dehydrogenase